MDGRDSVRAMRTHDGEIGHPHLTFRAFFDESHTLYPSFVAGKPRSHVIEQAAIDLVDDLEMTRQQEFGTIRAAIFPELRAATCDWCTPVF